MNAPLKIIFLDFDGVMATAYYDLIMVKNERAETDEFGVLFDPVCVDNLAKIIRATGAKIVVSSDWKYLMPYEELLRMWTVRNLPDEMIDATPCCSKHRGDEIDKWIEECPDDVQYVIIDDLSAEHFNEHQLVHLLVVNPFNGLTEEVATRAINILNNTKSPYHDTHI